MTVLRWCAVLLLGFLRMGECEAVRGDRYYLEVCGMDQVRLGTRGEVAERVYGGRQIRFCREACADAFERDRVAGFTRLDQLMIADQRPFYPLAVCVVTGAALPNGGTVEFISLNRLVRVATVEARAKFERDPEAYFPALDLAALNKHLPTYSVEKCPEQGTVLDMKATLKNTVVCANRIVRTCCQECAERVRERPQQYLPLIDSANRMLAEEKARKAQERPR